MKTFRDGRVASLEYVRSFCKLKIGQLEVAIHSDDIDIRLEASLRGKKKAYNEVLTRVEGMLKGLESL